MELKDCTGRWGDDKYRSTPPVIRRVKKATVVPKAGPGAWDHDLGWGVYDDEGHLVIAAAYRRGPGINYVGQSLTTSTDGWPTSEGGDIEAIYCGVGHWHYGHFITATLPRLWVAQSNIRSPDVKYLFHLDISVEAWLQIPFVSQIFDALQIKKSNILRVDEVTVFDELLVPEPSFEEGICYHEKFRELGLHIGERISPKGRFKREAAVYLSKEKLAGGVRRFLNEEALVEELAAGGVEIAYPESLSLRAQIELFSRARILLGGLGSAFHTAIFAPGSMSILALNHDTFVPSNFSMIDRLTGAKARYIYQDMTTVGEGDANFSGTFHLADPKAAAAHMLEIIGSKAGT